MFVEIRLALLAWQKAKFWALEARRQFHSEVGMFGLVSVEDPFLIEDVFLSHQTTSGGHFDMDENSHAVTLDALDAAGVDVSRLNAWVHSHPGTGKQSPSMTDLATIHRLLIKQHLLTVILDDQGNPGYGCVDVYTPRISVLADVVRLQSELPEATRLAALAQFTAAVRSLPKALIGPVDPLSRLYRSGTGATSAVNDNALYADMPARGFWRNGDDGDYGDEEEDQIAVRMQSGLLTPDAAVVELIALGYSRIGATRLVRAWEGT